MGEKRKISNAFLVVLVLLFFEVLYFAFLTDWLDQWFVFHFHLPSIFVFFMTLMNVGISYYEYHGFGPQEGIVRSGRNHPHVALTFDDGPNPDFTNKILDILKEKEVKAAFFMVGKHIEKYPEVAKRVYSEGHDIGNHTYSHRDLVPATRRTVIKEVQKCDQAIERVLGIKTTLFRPPRGIISNNVRKLIVAMGFTIALWTVSALDWRGKSPKAMIRRIMLHANGGGVILFHDSGALLRTEGASRENTVEALPLVIDALKASGFEIVLLSKMIRELDLIEEDGIVEALGPPSTAGALLGDN